MHTNEFRSRVEYRADGFLSIFLFFVKKNSVYPKIGGLIRNRNLNRETTSQHIIPVKTFRDGAKFVRKNSPFRHFLLNPHF